MKFNNKIYLAASLLLGSSSVVAQITDYEPVTEAQLSSPPVGDWLNWRGTRDAWGYSPLDQITRENVDQLQLAWAWAMDETGSVEAAPLVHDGVMFLPNAHGVIQALDAANGDLIWEYRPGITPALEGSAAALAQAAEGNAAESPRASTGGGVQKNIAIFGDMIYAATASASIVAIDARTGQLVWETAVADPELGYRYTAGPIVDNGTLVTGITGCER